MKQTSGEWVTVEFNGERKQILREKLPEAQQMAAHMQEAARREGYPEERIKEEFTLRIAEEDSTVSSRTTNQEVRQALLEFREKDMLRKQTDPEYRELWEKREESLKKIALWDDE